MSRVSLTAAFGGMLTFCGGVVAQTPGNAGATQDETARTVETQARSQESVEQKLERLENEIRELKASQRQMPAKPVGKGGTTSPTWFDSEFLDAKIPYQEEMLASTEADRVKVGGRIDFEFYDLHANRNNLGGYLDSNQFGNNGGSTEFRVRRLEIDLGLELIEDFQFQSRLMLDPVVRDEDEGAVDMDEAYVRFGNLFRNLMGIEDPSHTYIKVGNFYRWERDFLKKWSESFSMAGTSFYRDEVTGLQIGGDFEEGLFYRVGIDNGSQIASRDAGVGATRGVTGAVGNSPMLHDNEQLGDLNNNKDVSLGLGIKGAVEEPKFEYRAAVSYREGKLSATEVAFLRFASTSYDGGTKKRRFGVLGGFDWDVSEAMRLGVDAELWWAKDGNGDREVWSVAPNILIPLDGVYYQKRKFFTGVGFGYRLSGLHLHGGFPNQASLQRSILDDRIMHTIGSWVEVTRNVDLRLEINNMDPTQRNRSETEWLLQWSIRF
ncbi:MAG: hypothetical protein H6832_13370 [Planctomycetes bacterium]|nr:hypothetical protein [Planctomycetota bacterium]MCB9919386.1 hypothetical protein [Planctomycetota bacterium]